MFLEARAASCFSSTYVLKINGHPIGKFEGRWLSEGLDISLTGRRQLRFEKVSWLSSQFVLLDAESEDPVGQADRAGFFTSSWDLQLSCGPAQLVRGGWFETGYHIELAAQVLGRVDRIGMCERGFQVEGSDALSMEDLILAGLVQAALEALQKSLELSKGGWSKDWFVLAMAHWQLGDKEQARKWYDRAVEQMEKNKSQDVELRRFGAEATELLGIKPIQPSKKKD